MRFKLFNKKFLYYALKLKQLKRLKLPKYNLNYKKKAENIANFSFPGVEKVDFVFNRLISMKKRIFPMNHVLEVESFSLLA